MAEITFSGLASGMDTSSWIEALVNIKQQKVTNLQTKQTTLNSTKTVLDTAKSNVTGLRTAIEKFTDSKFGGSFDLFGKNSVSSSNSDVVTATATEAAARQSFDIVVNQLATSTTATSSYNAKINEDTEFSKLGANNAKEGAFSVYVDGKKSEINIEKDATLGDILEQLNNVEGINASIEDGKFKIAADEGHSVVVGSATDESNFASVVGLVRDAETGNYSSFNPVSAVSTSDKLVDVFGDSVKGTMKVGNAEITVDENTTFKSLIGKINANADAGVSAHWDATNGNLVLKSKAEGAFNINIEAGTSNLTDLLGFTSSSTDGEGNNVSSLVQSTQTLGDYAKFTVNGNNVVSSSNTVTSDISGIDGLTLTLKSVSKADDNGDINPATVSVEQDTKAVVDAAKAFVDAYNKNLEYIDSKTTYGEALYGETSLTQIRNSLRRVATASVGGSDSSSYKLLADIGITTGKAENSTDTSKVNKLQLDEEKFLKALKENPDSVKELLVGDNKGTSTSGGVLNKLEKITEDALASKTGYFDAKALSYDRQLNTLKSQITNTQSKVDSYKTRLTKQFQAMETAIASIQQSYSQLSI